MDKAYKYFPALLGVGVIISLAGILSMYDVMGATRASLTLAALWMGPITALAGYKIWKKTRTEE